MDYPLIDCLSLERVPELWDRTYVQGGSKVVLTFPPGEVN